MSKKCVGRPKMNEEERLAKRNELRDPNKANIGRPKRIFPLTDEEKKARRIIYFKTYVLKKFKILLN